MAKQGKIEFPFNEVDLKGGLFLRVFKEGVDSEEMIWHRDREDRRVAILESNPKLTYLLYLAWLSEVRTKSTAKEFDVWVDDIEVVAASELDPK